jgi:hypothetical protein
MNDLITKELDISVDFKQSQITVKNKEVLEQAIDSYSKKYAGLVFDKDSIADAKKAKAEMNNVAKGLDTKRKEVKKEYNEPLKQFESWVKELKGKIDKTIEPIDAGIKEIEEVEKLERKTIIEDLVAEMAEAHNVEVEEVPLNPKWWELVGSFGKNNKPNKKTLEDIHFVMTQVNDKKKQLESDILVVGNYAKAVGLEPESWTVQVRNGQTPAQLMKLMDSAIKEKNAKAEYEAAMVKLAEEQKQEQEINYGRAFDPETGEVVESLDDLHTDELPFGDDADPFPVAKEQDKTMSIRMTGANHLLIQARQYILGLGIKIDDLVE